MHLMSNRRCGAGSLTRTNLCDSRRSAPPRGIVEIGERSIRGSAGRRHMTCKYSELLLDRLKRSDRLAELHACPRILYRL